MRIAVIGAGIVGVQLAVKLAERGADVTVFERGEPGGGTTAGSFAWIDYSAPGIAPYLDLRLLGVNRWRRQAEELGWPSWLSLTGTLTWTRDPAEMQTLEAHLARLEARGRPAQRLSVDAAMRREPGLRVPPGVETVYRFEGEGWVQTQPAIAALLRRGRAAGLRLRTDTGVRELAVDASGRLSGIMLASGERLRTDVVVTCAGRFTESLLASAGVRVPMLVAGQTKALVAGLVVETSPVACRIGSVVLADGLLMRPASGGRLALHSDVCDAELTAETPRPEDGEKLLGMLGRRLRGTERARVHAGRICKRAIPADLRPVVGWALEGLYVAVSHSGVTLAPALADLVTAELIEDQRRDELEPFRPGRFEGVAA